jgi:hypothetical protein
VRNEPYVISDADRRLDRVRSLPDHPTDDPLRVVSAMAILHAPSLVNGQRREDMVREGGYLG